MVTDLKQITQDEVERVLRKNLDLNDNIRVGRSDRISNLVDDFGSMDLLGLMHDLGIDAWKYSSGEKMNAEGLDMLNYAVRSEKIPQDLHRLLYIECAKGQEPIIKTDEVAKMMTLGYLVRMAEYDAQHRTA
jgi:hypothetical protein